MDSYPAPTVSIEGESSNLMNRELAGWELEIKQKLRRRLRQKLECHFKSHFEKWSDEKFPLFPWKTLLHVLLIGLVTSQVSLPNF